MLYKDACNEKSNHKNLGTIKCSNLCTEIVEYTAPDEVGYKADHCTYSLLFVLLLQCTPLINNHLQGTRELGSLYKITVVYIVIARKLRTVSCGSLFHKGCYSSSTLYFYYLYLLAVDMTI